jgi:hypothetical protein
LKQWCLSKLPRYLLDFLMIIVPILEITELMAVIPLEYLPWYMLVTVLLRRGLRLLQEKLDVELRD